MGTKYLKDIRQPTRDKTKKRTKGKIQLWLWFFQYQKILLRK